MPGVTLTRSPPGVTLASTGLDLAIGEFWAGNLR
jgi:hypothetical protein